MKAKREILSLPPAPGFAEALGAGGGAKCACYVLCGQLPDYKR